MDIVDAGYEIMAAAASLTALCPVERINPPGDHQNLALPYIVHFPVSATLHQTHASVAAALQGAEYQVSIFGASYASVKAVADAVRDALEGIHEGIQFFFRNEGPLMFESDVRVHHLPLTFEAWGA